MAVQHVPLDQVVWLDCDTFPTRDLEYLFEDPEFVRTGAMFWPDVEGHYHVERATGKGQLFDNAGVDQALFPCVAALGPRRGGIESVGSPPVPLENWTRPLLAEEVVWHHSSRPLPGARRGLPRGSGPCPWGCSWGSRRPS